MASEFVLIINTISLVLFLGVLVGVIAEHLRLPKMVLLILVGIGISFFDPSTILNFEEGNIRSLTLLVAEIGLLLVLYQEGMHLNLNHLRKNILPVLLLAVLGTILTATTVAVITSAVSLGFSGQPIEVYFLGNLLIAAIVVPTDPAATFSILRSSGEKVKKNLETILAGESAFNDVIAILLVVIILLPSVESGDTSFHLSFGLVFLTLWQLLGGLLLGAIASAVTLLLMSQTRSQEESASLTVTSVFVIFSISQILGVSGAIASLTAGVIMANPHYIKLKRWYTKSFFDPFWSKLIFLIEIFSFTFIGMLFRREIFMEMLVPGLLLSILVLVVRILVVFISTRPLERSARTRDIMANSDRLFISVAGFKGLTTAVLALISYVTLVESTSTQVVGYANYLLYVSLMLILLSGLIQGLLLTRLSKVLNVYTSEEVAH